MSQSKYYSVNEDFSSEEILFDFINKKNKMVDSKNNHHMNIVF